MHLPTRRFASMRLAAPSPCDARPQRSGLRIAPKDVQQVADRSFTRLKDDPRHPSLRFKKVGRFWSARVGLRY